MPTVTDYITSAFHLARSQYSEDHRKWIDASATLAGRINVTALMFNVQRAAEADLVLRAMEDEFGKAPQHALAAHHQLSLSEIWILYCYEFLRAIRQREREVADINRKKGIEADSDAMSLMPEFVELFSYLELLRMPIAKLEIAKDDKMKEPLLLRAQDAESSVQSLYDRNDPARSHIMDVGISPNGRLGWLALDHANSRQFWIERRALSDLLLDFAGKVEPAGLREARLKAEAAAQPFDPE